MSEEREAKYAAHLKGWWFEGDPNVETVALSFWNTAWLAATKAARQSAGATGQKPFGWVNPRDLELLKEYGAVQMETHSIQGGKNTVAIYAAPIGDNGAKMGGSGAPEWALSATVKEQAQEMDDVRVALDLPEDCDHSDVIAEIERLKSAASQPAESKRVELTEGQVIEAIQKACGEYRHGCSYSFEDVWNCIEAALLARAQVKGE